MKRKVLLFGASGEIGGRIARLAIDAGHSVIGVTRGVNTMATADLNGVEMIQGDKNDPQFIGERAAKLDYDVVIDTVPSAQNVEVYRKYLDKAQNVFFCGSTGTYVPLRYFPADEEHPWRENTGLNFHSQSVRDALALDCFKSSGFPVSIFRPTNIIGPGRVPLELWGGRNIVFYRKLKTHEPVWVPPCEEILIQSGYNWDLASAFVLALDHPDRVRGEIFNISTKRAITLGAYLKTAMDFLGSRSPIQHADKQELCERYLGATSKGQLDFLTLHMSLDIAKAERVLGYRPSRTTQEGLIEALTWCREAGLL